MPRLVHLTLAVLLAVAFAPVVAHADSHCTPDATGRILVSYWDTGYTPLMEARDGNLFSTENGVEFDCGPLTDISAIDVSGGAGNDFTHIFSPAFFLAGMDDAPIHFDIDGGAGQNRLKLSGAGLTINGGINGIDVGGASDVDIVVANLTLVILQGTGGGPHNVNMAGGGALGTAFPIDLDIFGSLGADNLTGGLGDDYFEGALGGGIVRGGLGTNLMSDLTDSNIVISNTAVTANGITTSLTGIQNAQLYGGPGNNVISGNAFTGNLEVFAGPGDDRVTGGPGPGILHGEEGDDVMAGGWGGGWVIGGPGTDRVHGRHNGNITVTNNLVTGNGTEQIQGFESGIFYGGPGNNTFRNNGFAGTMTFVGEGGNDTFIGGPGRDVMIGGPGNDRSMGRGGNDAHSGGTGIDIVVETANASFTLSNNQLSGLGIDTLSGIDSAILTGGAGNNTIRANTFNGPARINGGIGNDILVGGPRPDVLVGGDGNDKLHGGASNDALLAGRGTNYCYGGDGTADTGSGCTFSTGIP